MNPIDSYQTVHVIGRAVILLRQRACHDARRLRGAPHIARRARDILEIRGTWWRVCREVYRAWVVEQCSARQPNNKVDIGECDASGEGSGDGSTEGSGRVTASNECESANIGTRFTSILIVIGVGVSFAH
jgi:hypothetical protein